MEGGKLNRHTKAVETPLLPSEMMKFGYVNIRSVCNKASVVNDFITENELDVMIITETWMTQTNENRVKAELLPNDFCILHRMRSGRRGGGIAVVHRNNIVVNGSNCSLQPSTFEYMKVLISHNHTSVCLLVIYRPPESTTTHFIEEFAELLTQQACCPTKTLIVGDFNLHWDEHTDNAVTYEAKKCSRRGGFHSARDRRHSRGWSYHRPHHL